MFFFIQLKKTDRSDRVWHLQAGQHATKATMLTDIAIFCNVDVITTNSVLLMFSHIGTGVIEVIGTLL